MKSTVQLIVTQKVRPKRGAQPANTNAQTHGLYRTRTGLSRQDRRRVNRYEDELHGLLPWLQPSDASTVRSFAHLLLMRDRIAGAMTDQGIVNQTGDVTRLATELRQTLTTLLAYSRELGLTPASRAALGLTAARGRQLDLAMAMSATGSQVDDDDE